MEFLVDVGVGRKVERWLVENGYDVKCMRDINPKAADSETLTAIERLNELKIPERYGFFRFFK